MQSPQTVRRLGWLLIVLGLALSVGMAVIGVNLRDTVLHSGEAGHGTYTGTHQMAVDMFTLFAVIFIFGLLSVANGIWQAMRSRHNNLLRAPMLIAFAIIAYYAYSMISKADAEKAKERAGIRT